MRFAFGPVMEAGLAHSLARSVTNSSNTDIEGA